MDTRLLLSRAVFCGLAMVLLGLAWWRRDAVGRSVRAFFQAEDDPLNLAVFRVALFGMLFGFSDLGQLQWFSQLPQEFRILPWGSRWWFFDVIPINEAWVTAAWTGLRAAAWLAMIGLWTRPAAAVAALLAVYVLGIPQLFGKVHHYHHLVWFAALLAASRCGDALSCDALIAAWRRAGRGAIEPPRPSRAYALPIRFVWLLIGVAYFFPGFWKWWAGGVDWIVGDNLKHHLYAQWARSNWLPGWRLDQHPLLYQLAALGTIVFELGFLWALLLVPRLRPALAVAGWTFHEGIKQTMKIRLFWTLQVCYVTFVNWAGLLRRLGRWLFPAPLFVAYDGNCRLCRRTIALLRTADWFERTTYVNALDEEALRQHGLHGLDRQALLVDMHAVSGTRVWRGYDAYRAMAWRIPLLWPVAPILSLWPVTAIGRRIYRHVADARSCEIGAGSQRGAPALRSMAAPAGTLAVTLVGGFLLLGNTYFGLRTQSSAWPLACYPTFRQVITIPEYSTLRVAVIDAVGQERWLDDRSMEQRATTGRWNNLLGSILSARDEGTRRQRLIALWQLWLRQDPSLARIKLVRFYKVTRSTHPAGEAAAAGEREELVWEMPL